MKFREKRDSATIKSWGSTRERGKARFVALQSIELFVGVLAVLVFLNVILNYSLPILPDAVTAALICGIPFGIPFSIWEWSYNERKYLQAENPLPQEEQPTESE